MLLDERAHQGHGETMTVPGAECWVLVLVLRATCSVPRCGEARRSVYGAKAAGAIVAVSAFLATAPLGTVAQIPDGKPDLRRLGSRTERTRPRSPNGFVE